MTVHFIGAGPGDPEPITVKGQHLIRQCPLAHAETDSRLPPRGAGDQAVNSQPGASLEFR
jgi:hypothetical protein